MSDGFSCRSQIRHFCQRSRHAPLATAGFARARQIAIGFGRRRVSDKKQETLFRLRSLLNSTLYFRKLMSFRIEGATIRFLQCTSNSRVDKPNRQSIPFAHLAKQQPAWCLWGRAILASVSFMAPGGTAQSSPAPPQIGSPNTVTADPLVSRPRTQPCVVQLFPNVRV